MIILHWEDCKEGLARFLVIPLDVAMGVLHGTENILRAVVKRVFSSYLAPTCLMNCYIAW